jgi:hypothetical protein
MTDCCRLQWQRLTHDRPDLSSEKAPQKRQNSNFEKKKSGQKSQIWLDTKTYWLTDRQSKCDFDLVDGSVRCGSLRSALDYSCRPHSRTARQWPHNYTTSIYRLLRSAHAMPDKTWLHGAQSASHHSLLKAFRFASSFPRLTVLAFHVESDRTTLWVLNV